MYRSILEASHHEILIQKSRFICHISPIASVAEARAFIEGVQKEHYNATHHVPVYVMGEDYHLQKFSDDGEPSGTAGLPVLEFLKHEAITNVALVITRYFGGIKLGKGGLKRAYTASARETLSRAEILTFISCQKVRILYDYSHHGKVENLLANMPEIFSAESVFKDQVQRILYIPTASEGVLESLVSLTRGELVRELLEEGHFARYGQTIIGGKEHEKDHD